jgi:cob(I)alamin adenosyltransferase
MRSRLYTGAGDQGATALADGSRVDKDGLRIETIGTVDELNALIGLVAAQRASADEQPLLIRLQNTLFSLGAELANPAAMRLTTEDVRGLEQDIDRLDDQLPPLEHFVLPGGSQSGALCHLARTVCRRAERALFRLARHDRVNSASLVYMNRLSDLLFALARLLVRRDGGSDVIWKGP